VPAQKGVQGVAVARSGGSHELDILALVDASQRTEQESDQAGG